MFYQNEISLNSVLKLLSEFSSNVRHTFKNITTTVLNSSLYLENVMSTKNNRQDQNQGTKNKNQISRMWLLWLNHGTVELQQMDVNISVHSVLTFHGHFQTWSWRLWSGQLYLHRTQVSSQCRCLQQITTLVSIYVGVLTDACSYLFFPLCFFFAIQLPACGATASKVMPLHNCVSLRNIFFCKTYSFVFSHNVLLHTTQHFHLIFLQAATLAAAC